MSDNPAMIFSEDLFLDNLTPYEEGLDADLAMYKIMDEFPSICELDPTEAFEKKKDRTNACNEAFKSPISFGDCSSESIFSGKFDFSFTTEDLYKESTEKDSIKMLNSSCSSPQKKLEQTPIEKKAPEVARVPQTRRRSSLLKSEGENGTYEESFSFGNRARFSKKHDREMFHILQTLCKQDGVQMEKFYDPEVQLSEELDNILTKLVYETKWRRSRKLELLQRVRKIASDTTFSVRDKKLLKRLAMKQAKNGTVDFEALLYHFPGKNIQMLKKQYALEEESIAQKCQK